MNKKAFQYYTEEGDEEEVELPVKMEVCPECEGHGTVLCEGMRGHAYTQEEFEREFDDEEREQYLTRGGIYDVPCPKCAGRNVIAVVDEDRLSKAQKPIYEKLLKQWADEARDRADDARTRRMESGGYE